MSQECPQLRKVSAQVQKFWEDKQTACADVLRRFSYAVLQLPSDKFIIEKHGLLYAMQRDLWFEDFPRTSSFAFLFQNVTPAYEKTLCQLPVKGFQQVRLVSAAEVTAALTGTPPRTGFFQQIVHPFSGKLNQVLITGQDAAGQTYHYAWRDLEEPAAWAELLNSLR